MIVVIADDLSGAAELAGAANRLGYSAEVQTEFIPDVSSQVVCVDSGGRGMSADGAAAGMDRLIRKVMSAEPDWIYLKFDSVLRGNILAELRAAMTATGRERALLVTANPGRGRVIRDGEYYVDGVALHETGFAADPEYPRTTSNVRELLGEPLHGIATPDVQDPRELMLLAAGLTSDSVPAGSAEFLEALLVARGTGHAEGLSSEGSPALAPATGDLVSWAAAADERSTTLLICGSLGAWATRCGEARQRKVRIYSIDDDPRSISRTMSAEGIVLLGIGDRVAGEPSPAALVARLAETAASVIAAVPPRRLLLEGGATAAATLRRLGWTRMISRDGVGQGPATLTPAAVSWPVVLIKPGSYRWPPEVW